MSTPIIDTHQHLWDLRVLRLPWTQSVPELTRSFLMSDYLEATRDSNVAATVYMEVDCHPDDRRAELDFVAALCEASDNPMRAAVVGGNPGDDGFADWARVCGSYACVRGIRLVLHTPDRPYDYCLRDEFVAGVRTLGELGLSFDLCHPPSLIAAGAELAALAPDTRFIVDHCGNADPYGIDDTWRDGIRRLADQPNTIMKISGIVARAKPGWTLDDLRPAVQFCLDAFGSDRCVFGGDWPVCTLGAPLADWIAAARTLVGPEVLYDNAVRVYRL